MSKLRALALIAGLGSLETYASRSPASSSSCASITRGRTNGSCGFYASSSALSAITAGTEEKCRQFTFVYFLRVGFVPYFENSLPESLVVPGPQQANGT